MTKNDDELISVLKAMAIENNYENQEDSCVNNTISKCLSDLRYSYEYKVPLEKILDSYSTYVNTKYMAKEAFENFCLFVYKTNLNDKEILNKLEKHSNYKSYIMNQNSLSKFFVEREPLPEKQYKPVKRKKYTTYYARGHFHTNNPVSAFISYMATLPTYILILIMSGLATVITNFINLFKTNEKE